MYGLFFHGVLSLSIMFSIPDLSFMQAAIFSSYGFPLAPISPSFQNPGAITEETGQPSRCFCIATWCLIWKQVLLVPTDPSGPWNNAFVPPDSACSSTGLISRVFHYWSHGILNHCFLNAGIVVLEVLLASGWTRTSESSIGTAILLVNLLSGSVGSPLAHST